VRESQDRTRKRDHTRQRAECRFPKEKPSRMRRRKLGEKEKGEVGKDQGKESSRMDQLVKDPHTIFFDEQK